MRRSVADRLKLPSLALLFLFSGACGLIYQVLWLRLLGLTFGVTVYAASTVWASFMAGLAVGSLVGGWLGDRVRRPLVWFGAAEILVGLSALASPRALDALQRFYVAAYPSFPDSSATMTLARGVIAFAVLIIPTLLMGATLPLVVRSVLARREDLGSRVGLLYGTNTAGAIAGTVLAGLYFIPTLGISRTFQVAAAVNVLVGIAAVALSLLPAGERIDPAPAAIGAAGPDADAPGATPGVRRLVLGVFALSGFASLALEVIWFRVIILVARPYVYTFSMILASVLLGIALGSYVVTPFMRRHWNWIGVLAVVEIVMSGTVLLSLATLGSINTINAWIEPSVSAVLPAYLSYSIAGAVPAVLPTCLLMGIAFPIGLRLWASDGQMSRIATFYSLNLAGAIAGSIAAGFVLLPRWGSRTSLIGVAALVLASGVALLLVALRRPLSRAIAAVGVPILFIVSARQIADPYDAFLSVRWPSHRVLFREEAVQGTVSVHDQGNGRRGLYLDGNHQASDAGSMVYVHRVLGNLPMALHPAARAALVVGLGGGATAGAVSAHEGVDVDVIELSESVIRAAEFFRHVNFDLLNRPNVHVRVDDGRNYLLLTPRKYDVVTADIILPIHAGSNNIYSREYFSLVRKALKPDGLIMQWVAGTDAEHKTIVRTFLSVFPNTTLWGDGTIMIGSIQPLKIGRGDYEWKRQWPGRRQALDALGANTWEKLLALYVAGPEELRRYVGDGPILTDDRPLAEYFLSLPRDKGMDLTGVRGDVRQIVAP